MCLLRPLQVRVAECLCVNGLERRDERELALRNVLQAPSSDLSALKAPKRPQGRLVHASLREAQTKGLNRYNGICPIPRRVSRHQYQDENSLRESM